MARKKEQDGMEGTRYQSATQVESSGPLQAKRTTVPNPNLLTIYANGFQIAVGPLDVRMVLMEAVPVSQTEVIDRQVASVIMTPETLKLLATSIGRFVEAYEKNFGKIREFPAPESNIQQIYAPVQKPENPHS
jgi:Protein of unknown function (DUF3467)